MASTAVLDAVPRTYLVDRVVRTGRFRRRFAPQPFTHLDLTVDGVPLRRLVAWPDGTEDDGVTPLQNDDAGPAFATAHLQTLMGREHSSEYVTALPDGRVALHYCAFCYDLGCGALSADLVLDEATVTWRDIGYQNDYEPLDLSQQDAPVITVTFDRAQYETVLDDLLRREAARLSAP